MSNVIDNFVEAGVKAIDESGPDRITVSQVTAMAGASRPTFYSYFGNVEGLLAEIWIARGRTFLDRLFGLDFRIDKASPEDVREVRALLEVFAVARRIPEVAEVVAPSLALWWKTNATGTDFEKLALAWRAANRIGMWLTEPVEPRARSAAFVEAIIGLLGPNPTGVPADPRFAKDPKVTDPVLADSTVEGQLLDATIRVIASSGASAASMSRIARNAQVTTGSIYPRFDNSNELILQSFELAVSAVTEQNFGMIDGGGFAADQFGAIVRAGLRPERRMWRNFRFEMYLEARNNRELADHLQKALNNANKRVIDGLSLIPLGAAEKEASAFLVHDVGIGMAVLFNNGLPVDSMDHRVITREMIAALARR